MAGPLPSQYGDRHASVYDRIYGSRFASEAAVEVLSAAAGGGKLLELGLGTGRLALPLVRRGVHVDGVEASTAMIARLRAQPDGHRVGAVQADLANFDLARRDYAVAVCAVSTLFMLEHHDQTTCLAAVARHLRPGGRLFIEVFRPDPSRYDTDGRRVEHRTSRDGTAHVVRSQHDAHRRRIDITHELTDNAGVNCYHVTLHYATIDELDHLADRAGLRRVARWHDWNAHDADESSTDPISVYERVILQRDLSRDPVT